MPTPRADTAAVASGSDLWAGRDAPALGPGPTTPTEVQSTGVTVLSTNPRAVYRASENASYFGWVSNGGTVGVSRIAHGSGDSITALGLTASGFDRNDHACPSLHFRQDGRLQVFYSKHNDPAGIRWRVQTSVGDVSSWGSEQALPSLYGDVTYSNPRFLSAAGRLFLFYRGGTKQVMRYSDDDGDTWSSETEVFALSGQRPYPYIIVNGANRLDCVVVEDSPISFATASVYHCYALWESGSLNWYDSNGDALTLPINPTSCTKVMDGASAPLIWQDMAFGSDGHPRVTAARFNSTTDSDYLFSRWTGSAWTTPAVISNGGHPLYQPEWAYCGGCTFDPYDANRVYVSSGSSASGPWELATYQSADSGATWAKTRDITSGSATGQANFRPAKVEGQGPLRVSWSQGTYPTFTTYTSKIMAVS